MIELKGFGLWLRADPGTCERRALLVGAPRESRETLGAILLLSKLSLLVRLLHVTAVHTGFTHYISKGELLMIANTVQLHRVLRATPEKIYRAFLDAEAMARWLPPNGFTAKVHHMDAKVGGTYKMSFTNFTTGRSHSFGGTYLELATHERIRYTCKFDDPNLAGEMQTTITLKKVSCGAEIDIVQEGIPNVIPTDACYLGWQESLAFLAKLVEPEIPD